MGRRRFFASTMLMWIACFFNYIIQVQNVLIPQVNSTSSMPSKVHFLRLIGGRRKSIFGGSRAPARAKAYGSRTFGSRSSSSDSSNLCDGSFLLRLLCKFIPAKAFAAEQRKKLDSTYANLKSKHEDDILKAALIIASDRQSGGLVGTEVSNGTQSDATAINPACYRVPKLSMGEVSKLAQTLYRSTNFQVAPRFCPEFQKRPSIISEQGCFLDKVTTIGQLYDTAILSLLMGSTPNEAFAILRHARSLIYALEVCSPMVNSDSSFIFPDSYSALYDIYHSKLIGRLKQSRRLRVVPGNTQMAAIASRLSTIKEHVLSIPYDQLVPSNFFFSDNIDDRSLAPTNTFWGYLIYQLHIDIPTPSHFPSPVTRPANAGAKTSWANLFSKIGAVRQLSFLYRRQFASIVLGGNSKTFRGDLNERGAMGQIVRARSLQNGEAENWETYYGNRYVSDTDCNGAWTISFNLQKLWEYQLESKYEVCCAREVSCTADSSQRSHTLVLTLCISFAQCMIMAQYTRQLGSIINCCTGTFFSRCVTWTARSLNLDHQSSGTYANACL